MNHNNKSIENNDLNNKNNEIFNKISFNNFFTKNINNKINKMHYTTPKNYPKDTPNKNKIINPHNSGSPHDSKSKKSIDNIKLIKLKKYKNQTKFNTYEGFLNNNKEEYINIDTSLPHNITINKVNYNNEIILNQNLGKTTKKEDNNINNEQGSEKGELEGNHKNDKILGRLIEINNNKDNVLKKNELKLNKIKKITLLKNDKVRILKKRKIKIKINKSNSYLEKNKINDFEVNNTKRILNDYNWYNNGSNYNTFNQINNINSIKNNSQNYENIYINNNKNQIFSPEKRITHANIIKYRSSSPIPIQNQLINNTYRNYYGRTNNYIKNPHLIRFFEFENKDVYNNNTFNNFYPGGTINVLYRNNLINMKNLYNNNDYFSNFDIYNNGNTNNTNSYPYVNQ